MGIFEIMTWLALALMTAFFESLRDVFNKKAAVNAKAPTIVWALCSFTALFLLPVTLATGTPHLTQAFWKTLLANSGLNLMAYLLFIKAIHLSDLSKVVPLTSFTPLFLLFTAPIMVGEVPNAWGLVGVVAIVAGAYTLNLEKQRGWLDPFKRLLHESGSQLMLTVALLWSITSNLDKIGIQASAPIFWVFSVYLAITLLLSPLVLGRWQSFKNQIHHDWKTFTVIGLFNAITVAAQMGALSLTLVAYVIAIKRASSVFSVIWGWTIFRESGLKTRLTGASMMLVGVGTIALSQTLR